MKEIYYARVYLSCVQFIYANHLYTISFTLANSLDNLFFVS